MKNIIIATLIFFSQALSAQHGVSFSYSTTRILDGNFFFGKGSNRFYIGYGYQFNGQKHKVVKKRESNYGTTSIKEGNFLWLIDFGYSRTIKNRLSVNPEISFGQRHFFTSYKDDRFKDDGYSLIRYSESVAAIGVNLGYLVKESFEPFVGYHTAKKFNFGIRFIF